MFGRNHRLIRRIAAGFALVATLALLLHGGAHAGVHKSANGGETIAHTAAHVGHADHAHADHAHAAHAHGSHAHQHADHGTTDKPDDCCCGTLSCMAAVLLPPAHAMLMEPPSRAMLLPAGNRNAGFAPDGPRRPPRPTAIA